MRKLITITLTLVVTLIGAALIVPFLIPIDTYKKELVTRLSERTGRDIRIDGDMRLTLLPNVAVQLEKVRIGNPKGYKSEYFAAVDVLDVEVALQPLFSKQVDIKRLILKKPVVNLEVNKAGEPNWDISLKQSSAISSLRMTSYHQPALSLVTSAYAAEGEAKSKSFTLKTLTLEGLSIENGTVSYLDSRRKTEHHLNDVNLTADAVAYEKPVAIKGHTVWNGERVNIEAKVESLQKLMDAAPTRINANIDSAHLKLVFSGTASPSGATGKVDAGSPSLVKVAEWLGAPIAWNKTPLLFAARGDLDCSTVRCTLAAADIAIDNIRLSGNSGVEWGGAIPRVSGKLATGTLDLTPYLQSPKTAVLNGWLISNAYAASPRWDTAPIDLSGLKAMNADISLTADSIITPQVTLGKTAASMQINNSNLSLTVGKTSLFGGSASGVLTAAPTGGASFITTKINASGVNVESMLQAMAGDSRITGTGDLTLDVSGKGRSQADIISTLNGNGSTVIRNGAIKGINLAQMGRNVKSAFTAPPETQQTDFAELGGTFTITNGTIINNDIALKAPYLRVSGQGKINLPQYTINYRLLPELVDTSKGQGGADDKQGIGVPIIVEGSLDHPTFRPDVGSVVKDVLKNPEKYKENFKDIKKSVKEEVRDIKSIKQNVKDLKKNPMLLQDLLSGKKQPLDILAPQKQEEEPSTD